MELEEATRERALESGSAGTWAGDPDRLSALPDCLLHTIMSFLKARQVVQTCVLAARWRHLWRSAPCLDIDLDEFMTSPVGFEWYSGSDSDSFDLYNDINNKKEKAWEDFQDFAENLMHRRNIALLDSFRLRVRSVPRSYEPKFADRVAGGWLRRAMKYCTPEPPRPCEGLNSNSWHLKRLYLRNVALDNRFTKHVSLVCHSLEDLELKDCRCEIRAITSDSLKNLVLKNCKCYRLSEIKSPTLKSLLIAGGSNTNEGVLVIVVPVIAHLCLDVPLHFARRISINQMLSLPRC
ncbi:unnamed protein product [Urochloa decumbens]|uniref:F-box domain-containing protein n=1 Tax=Urochloa decumbens TaxID=240449 RepID=A0ABC9ARX9_9POAL